MYTRMCAHTHRIAALKRKEIVPLVKTWVDLEGIILSEMSQRKRNTIGSHRWDLKTPKPRNSENSWVLEGRSGGTVRWAKEGKSPNLRPQNNSVLAL